MCLTISTGHRQCRPEIAGRDQTSPDGIAKLTDCETDFGKGGPRRRALSCPLDTDLLPPDPERFGSYSPIAGGRHAMTPRPEVSVDDAVSREKALCVNDRLEPLHLPLSSARWPVRVFSTIVQIAARTMLHIGQQSTACDAVAAQAIGDDALRLILQPLQQAFEEPIDSNTIALLLHQDVQHDPMLIDRTPEIVLHTVQAEKHLIQMPRIAWPRPASMQPPGKVSTELAAPEADALVGDHHAPFSQDQFDVAQAEAEQMIQPYSMADDLAREAVAVIQQWLSGHAGSLAGVP